MNWYCLNCAAVWFTIGDDPDCCADCGHGNIASQSALNDRFVRECVLPLPIGDSKAIERHLAVCLSGNLNYQDMILNGPFAAEDTGDTDR
jgi:hypothetical protein